jgi:hypothetical protein
MRLIIQSQCAGNFFYNLLFTHREKQGVKVVHKLAKEVAKVVNITLLKDEKNVPKCDFKRGDINSSF